MKENIALILNRMLCVTSLLLSKNLIIWERAGPLARWADLLAEMEFRLVLYVKRAATLG